MIIKRDGTFKIYAGWCKECGNPCKEVTIHVGIGLGKYGGGEPKQASNCCDAEIEYERN